MSDTETFNVKKREQTGTLRMRRMRKAGHTPAVLYGMGGESVALTLDTREVNAAIRHGSHVVKLAGDLSESVLIKDIQWNAFGNEILHLDLSRFDAKEDIEVQLRLELRGIAPGSKQGGTVQQAVHQLGFACAADKVPDEIHININELELDQQIQAKDLQLPESVKLVGDPEEILVTCTVVEQVESDEPADFSASPEVIGEKKDDDSDQEG